MNLRQAIREAKETLSAADIDDALLESEVLLMHSLKIDRVKLYIDIDSELTPQQYEGFLTLFQRRLTGEPSAYITGNREFYDLDFFVNQDVLIPRPETELLVEKAIDVAKKRSYKTIVDTGTGSGVVAICLSLNLPEAVVYATDISAPALEVASMNCQRHRVEDRVTLLCGNLLEPLPEPVDMIVANLPYVTDLDIRQVNTAGHEPETALNGGKDGLEYIIAIVAQSVSKLLRGGSILLEVGEGQSQAASRQLRGIYPYGGVNIYRDFAGIERVVSLSLPQETRLIS
ncbi:MAG: protein-(glutamine-N5) methyltransferase, release factor-specific [Chloroflexi bacterium RBG_13_46_14]|nr:MAG: protein-(glutamine-N5) methyltransferase, release factor-specific [Chloroflexi bacterium RBG_13_46_14]